MASIGSLIPWYSYHQNIHIEIINTPKYALNINDTTYEIFGYYNRREKSMTWSIS